MQLIRNMSRSRPTAGTQSKYAALTAWLTALPEDQAQATLTLEEIAHLIGTPLPAGAWAATFWTSGVECRRPWERVGFRAHLNRGQRAAEFLRMQRPS